MNDGVPIWRKLIESIERVGLLLLAGYHRPQSQNALAKQHRQGLWTNVGFQGIRNDQFAASKLIHHSAAPAIRLFSCLSMGFR